MIFLLSFFSIFSFPILAGNLDNLNLPDHFTADFQQTRFIKATDMKLKSSGTVEVIRNEKLIWHQREPFENTIEVKANSLQDGEKGKDLGPIAHFMGKLVLDLFKRDLSSLKKFFEIDQNNGLTMSLQPKDTMLKKAIKIIQVKGKNTIESFFMEEQSGNYLMINFSNLKNKNE